MKRVTTTTGWKKRALIAGLLAGSAGILGIPAADAGMFGAIDNLANAAEDAGVHVPNSVYEAGSVASDVREAGQSVTPDSPAPTTNCPPGYSCTPVAPPPVCPPGETCTPISSGQPQMMNQSSQTLSFPILPRERQHVGNPYYIQFVYPTRNFLAINSPIIETLSNGSKKTQFEISGNNRQLPYLSPASWQKYLVETYRLWPSMAPIPTQSLIPGDVHGGLYTISAGRYHFLEHHAVSFFMGNAQGQVRIAQERAQGKTVPNLWVFLDPDCTLSHDFFMQAEKYADAGQIDIHAIITGMDHGSTGRAEAILSSRVPGASGAGVGEMAENTLSQDLTDFSYSPEVGGIAPMYGDAAALHLVQKNERLLYAVSHTYKPAFNGVVYPTMVFAYRGTDYLYANVHSTPIWYTALLNQLASVS